MDLPFVITPFLTVYANFMGETRIERDESWQEAAVLFTAFLGRPGSRKSTALSAAADPAIPANKALSRIETITSGKRNFFHQTRYTIYHYSCKNKT